MNPNPRMNEVSDVIRARFPLVDGKGRPYRADGGWYLTLTQRPRHIRVLLTRGDVAYRFAVPNNADPAVVVERAVSA